MRHVGTAVALGLGTGGEQECSPGGWRHLDPAGGAGDSVTFLSRLWRWERNTLVSRRYRLQGSGVKGNNDYTETQWLEKNL